MGTFGKRMRAVIFGVIASVVCVSSASAQCSSWTNTMAIGAKTATIITTELSNGAAFIFWVSPGDDLIAFTVDGDGLKELKDWDEDANGTATLRDDFGRSCTIECDGSGGIKITLSGSGFTTLTWNVDSNGVEKLAGNVCGCSRSSGFYPSQNVVCDATACANTTACRPNNAGYCQNGTAP